MFCLFSNKITKSSLFYMLDDLIKVFNYEILKYHVFALYRTFVYWQVFGKVIYEKLGVIVYESLSFSSYVYLYCSRDLQNILE